MGESLRKNCNISLSVSLNISTFSSSKKNCDRVNPNALQMHCNVSNFGGELRVYIEFNVPIGNPAIWHNL